MSAFSQFSPYRSKSRLSRRGVLRGLGVALTLPWLEALAPRSARGQLLPAPKRYLPISFPSGASTYWWPAAPGVGDAWQLSPVLEPLQPIKEHVTVLGNLENGSCSIDGYIRSYYHSVATSAYLTCRDAHDVRAELGLPEANGVSIDQVLAQRLPRETPIESLQLGLATTLSYCDGQPCSSSRAISWRTETEPLLRVSDPGQVFDALVAAGGGSNGQRQKRLDASVIDAVLDNAQELDGKLGKEDRARLDQYLTSLRSVEERITGDGCGFGARPTMTVTTNTVNGPDYDRVKHFEIMNELIALGLACDSTRFISYMLDDARSEFMLDTVPLRSFSPTGSTPSTSGVCLSPYVSMHYGATSDQYATVNWFFVSKVSELCQRLAGIQEGEGSVLDSTVVQLGTPFRGPGGASDWLSDLPILLVGGRGQGLRTNQYVRYAPMPESRPLRDLYYTLATQYFGVELDSFGIHTGDKPLSALTELLAV